MPRHCIRARHGRACVVFSLWAPREGRKGRRQRGPGDEKEWEKHGTRWRSETGEKKEKKKNSWERWTSRQTDSLEKLAHQPPPGAHHAPQTLDCVSWALICRNGQR